MGRTALLACPEGGMNLSAMAGLDRSSFNTEPGLRFSRLGKKAPAVRTGAHKKVIEEITIMASVRRDWQRNNGYLVRTGYPLFFCRHEKQ